MSGLVLSFQLAAFSCQILAAGPDAETAVAIAVGLARMSQPTVETSISVEAASPEPSAKPGPRTPEAGQIQWVPTCDEHGCRLVPRVVLPEALLAAPQLGKDAAADSSTNSAAASTSCGNGRCGHANRRIFGRRR